MLAAEHLHTDALLVVLLATALAVAALRVAGHFLQRVRAARDRSLLGMRGAATPVAERDP